LRGFQEDGLPPEANASFGPGEGLEFTLPFWRVAEILLRVNELAKELVEGDYSLRVKFHWEGLAGRRLVSLNADRYLWDSYKSKQNVFETRAELIPEAIEQTLPETVDRILRPFYALFDFFEPPPNMAKHEIERMLSGRI
jgi:hypothetical protein